MPSRCGRSVWLLLALPLAAALASRADAQVPPNAVQAESRAAEPLRMRPGDVIRVLVWAHPELSGDFPIDENYQLLYPIIGAIALENVTVAELRSRLNTDLEQLFRQPFVTVTPLFRVAVLGEVLRPGLLSVDPTLTVLEILALAGGPTPRGNQRDIRLLRGGEEISIGYDRASFARATLRELGIRSGDQVFVPRRGFTREDLSLVIQIATLVTALVSVFIR